MTTNKDALAAIKEFMENANPEVWDSIHNGDKIRAMFAAALAQPVVDVAKLKAEIIKNVNTKQIGEFIVSDAVNYLTTNGYKIVKEDK